MKTITILTAILLLSCISAIDIQAGESYSFTLSEQYSYYDVTGNQTEVDLNITQIGNNVTINFGKYINDTFTITFYNWKDEVIEYTGQQGGGSSYVQKEVIENETEIPDFVKWEEDEVIDEIIITPEKDEWKITLFSIILIGALVLIFLIFKKKGGKKWKIIIWLFA